MPAAIIVGNAAIIVGNAALIMMMMTTAMVMMTATMMTFIIYTTCASNTCPVNVFHPNDGALK